MQQVFHIKIICMQHELTMFPLLVVGWVYQFGHSMLGKN